MLTNEALFTVERQQYLPHATLDNEVLEMPIPDGRPDIVVNPSDFEEVVRNEDYRYHRLPMGTLENIDIDQLFSTTFGTVHDVVAHGDGKGEGLLFPVLYPYGRGLWRYRKSKPLTSNHKSLSFT